MDINIKSIVLSFAEDQDILLLVFFLDQNNIFYGWDFGSSFEIKAISSILSVEEGLFVDQFDDSLILSILADFIELFEILLPISSSQIRIFVVRGN